MIPSRSILLALDGSPEAARGVGCALWLAEALGATLHVVHATANPLPAMGELSRLRASGAQGAHVIVHQLPGPAEEAVLEEIANHRINLVVMSAGGESASAGAARAYHLGTVARAVLQLSPVPVVLLPARYRESLPWESMLAAASGDAAADQALDAAVRLASALRLKVTVVHSEDGPAAVARAPLGACYADAPHHEYPGRLEQMVERGLTSCSREEAHCIDEVVLSRGDAALALLEQVRRLHSDVLALGWHGTLGAGRALVFKYLMEQSECALLVVRETPERSRARLKVGSSFDEA